MNLQSYQEKAKRTVNWEIDYKLQLAGFVLGIVGEKGELKKVIEGTYMGFDRLITDIMDEGGDVLWYIVNLCSQFGIDWTNLLPEMPKSYSTPRLMFDEMEKHISTLADMIKKHTVQEHPIDLDEVLEALTGIVGALVELFAKYQVSPDEVCEFNYTKLLKRYPDGFESSRSLVRAEVQ
jgi:NTP pyrophosphatase (non-canonical NTP hydrolase)